MVEICRSYDEASFKDKNILIHHHLGLGDHIVLNGLVNYISERHNRTIYLLCKSQYYENVIRLYQTSNNIVVVPFNEKDEYVAAQEFIEKNLEKNDIYFKLGHELFVPTFKQLNEKYHWDCGQVFYHMANIPYEHRYYSFKLNYDKEKNDAVIQKLNPDNSPFVFVHDDPSRGYDITISNKKVIKNDMQFSIFDYEGLLRQAEEIHVMASSFFCFIESLSDLKAKLFFHKKIRTSDLGSIIKHDWKVIE